MGNSSFNKVVVLGSSCSGKTTFSRRFAKATGSKHIELDGFFWEPDWKEVSPETFRTRVKQALNTESWVVDGNYATKIKDIVWPQADTFVWLDLPLITVLRRFFLRSLSRSLKREVLWGGCQESLRSNIFSRNSLLLWILKSYRKKQSDYLDLFKNPPRGTIVLRLRSSRDVERFFRDRL